MIQNKTYTIKKKKKPGNVIDTRYCFNINYGQYQLSIFV